MKYSKQLAFLAGLAGFFLTRLVAATSADLDFKAIQDAVAERAPASAQTGAAAFHWRVDQAAKLNDRCEKFVAGYPNDPRRWEAVLIMIERPRMFIKSFDDALLDQQRSGSVVRGAVTYDFPARAAHAQKLAEWDAQAEAATDMTPEFRKKYLLGRIVRKVAAAGTAITQRKPVDLGKLRVELDHMIGQFPDEPEVAKAFNSFVTLHKRSGANAEALVPLLEAYVGSPSAGVREVVQAGLMMKRAQEFPIDWKFTAADGRTVDFAQLRGKVVLIDFWATWCHPCVDEIPNVVKAYEKFHARGFEVVGISLENAGVPADATPAAAEAKLAAARKKLLEFTAKNGMPWPQYFDGTGWKNPYTTRYGIRGIPAMYLLDMEGKVVTLDARGAKLEPAIEALLSR